MTKKKRKTRQQKIRLRQKRERRQKQKKSPSDSALSEARQGAISKHRKKLKNNISTEKKPDISIYYYDPRLIKKDLVKTLVLALGIISLEIVIYLRLR